MPRAEDDRDVNDSALERRPLAGELAAKPPRDARAQERALADAAPGVQERQARGLQVGYDLVALGFASEKPGTELLLVVIEADVRAVAGLDRSSRSLTAALRRGGCRGSRKAPSGNRSSCSGRG